MDRGIGSRVPTLGLPGFEGYGNVVADGEAITSFTGHKAQDYSNGTPCNYNTMGDLHRFANKTAICQDIMAQCDSGFSSGFSSTASNMSFLGVADDDLLSCSGNITVKPSNNTDSLYLAPYDAYADDEAYSSLNSLPPAETIFSQDVDGDTMLHMAIIQESNQLALDFISTAQKPTDLMLINNLGQTALHLAAYINMPQVVDTLIQRQVALDTRNRDGNTALHLACREGHLCVAKSLVAAQPGLASVMNYDGLSCLHLAVKHEKLQIAALLIHSGAANVNAGDGCSGRTVLHQAVQAGQKNLVHFLVTKCNANVNATARDGLTPLMIAIGQQQHSIASFLQQCGAVYVDHVADDGFCSEDDMDTEADLYKQVQRMNLNSDCRFILSDDVDLYS